MDFVPGDVCSSGKRTYDDVQISIRTPKLMCYFAHSPLGKVPFNGNTYSLGHNESKPVSRFFISPGSCI